MNGPTLKCSVCGVSLSTSRKYHEAGFSAKCEKCFFVFVPRGEAYIWHCPTKKCSQPLFILFQKKRKCNLYYENRFFTKRYTASESENIVLGRVSEALEKERKKRKKERTRVFDFYGERHMITIEGEQWIKHLFENWRTYAYWGVVAEQVHTVERDSVVREWGHCSNCGRLVHIDRLFAAAEDFMSVEEESAPEPIAAVPEGVIS